MQYYIGFFSGIFFLLGLVAMIEYIEEKYDVELIFFPDEDN